MEMRTTSRRDRGLFRRRPSPKKGEKFIAGYQFPAHIERGVRRKQPTLSDYEYAEIEQGLRDWFICCAWRGGTTLAMPSRVVDLAWHEFILDSASYIDFCDRAYGEYLHHIPEGDSELEDADGETELVQAWDRSDAGAREGESILWNLDRSLGIELPLGIAVDFRRAVRSRYRRGGGGDGGALPMDFGGDGSAGGGGGCGGGCGGGGGV